MNSIFKRSIFKIIFVTSLFSVQSFATGESTAPDYTLLNRSLLLAIGKTTVGVDHDIRGKNDCGIRIRVSQYSEKSEPYVAIWSCSPFLTDCDGTRFRPRYDATCTATRTKAECGMTDCEEGGCGYPGTSLEVTFESIKVNGQECFF
jgi:hypothetical protein